MAEDSTDDELETYMNEEALDYLADAMERQASALESLAKIIQRTGLEDCIDDQTEKLTEMLSELVKASSSKPPITVDIPASNITMEAPVINVPAPVVTISEREEKQPLRYLHNVVRDSYGLITSIETVVVY